MQLTASSGGTCDASSKMTTSKRMSAGRNWQTASGLIMKHGLTAAVVDGSVRSAPGPAGAGSSSFFASDECRLAHVVPLRAESVRRGDNLARRCRDQCRVQLAELLDECVTVTSPQRRE